MFNYVASKNDMTGEFNEWQKTEIKIWICVVEKTHTLKYMIIY